MIKSMSNSTTANVDSSNERIVDDKGDNSAHECTSELHCWNYDENPRKDCSLFNGIKVKLAAFGAKHVVIVSKDLNVLSVGSNDYGQLGLGDRTDRKSLREVFCLSEQCITEVACGYRHSAAVTRKGQLFCWGDSRQGQCGQGELGIFTTPCRVQFPMKKQISMPDKKGIKVQKVSCGDMHTLVVDTDGCLWCFGSGNATGLGKDTYKSLIPKKVPQMQDKYIKDISCGQFHSIVLVRKDQSIRRSEDYISSSIMSRSLSDTEQSDVTRTDSNVAQKIPFLENIFYTEEEDGSINWSSEMPKLSRSDTPIFYQPETGHDFDDLKQPDSNKIKDESECQSNENSVAEDVAETNKEAKHPCYDKKHFALSFKNEVFQIDDNHGHDYGFNEMKRSKSCPTLSITDIGKSLKSTSTDSSISIRQLLQKKFQKNPGIAHIDIDGKFRFSEQDLFYSALDSLDKSKEVDSAEKKPQHFSCVSMKDIGVEFGTRKDPLCPSMDVEMENMICIPSELVIFDETFKEKATLKANRTESLWSISAETNSFDVEKIGSSSRITESYEVWVWGDNSCGQLGIESGNHHSLDPVCVDSLKGRDVVKVSAGEKHSLALTRSSLVFGWGDNSCGQLGLHKSAAYSPQSIQLLSNVRAWDIAAGGEFSLFLADSASSSCQMLHLGKIKSELESDFSVSSHTSGKNDNKNKNFKTKKVKSKHEASVEFDRTEWYADAELRKITHFQKYNILRHVIASTQQFACITESDTNDMLKIMYKLASSERNYHFQMTLIHRHILEPLQNTDAWSSVTKLPGGEALFALMDCFNDLLQSIMIGLSQLTEVISSHQRVRDLFSFFFSDSFRAVYDQYSKCYCDTLAVGHLHSFSKTISYVISKLDNSVKAVLNELVWEQFDLAASLKMPLKRSSYYCKCVEKLSRCVKASSPSDEQEVSHLLQVVHRWQSFADHTSKRLREADETREFWDKSPAKLIEALKDPHRRILKTNRNSPLSLARASRLSSHFFMLFNDVFVHSQSHRNFQVFPLVTMWAEPLLETEQLKFALKVTGPEASMVLVADSNDGRIDWLRELNEAIANCLSATSSHRVTCESVNSISGVLRAADAREASYTYVNHQVYKGARYYGMWMSGVPHGRGRIDWPNGETFEGEFANEDFNGYGIMLFSNIGSSPNEDRYEGDWFQGKMNGFGKMRYRNGDEYIGNWSNGIRSGHGTLKTSTSDRGLVTIYIGDWSNDQKNGYGVQDFVVRGEKYIGMWMNNQRHGYGIVVTVDGVYYEGRFIQNRLAGKGILLSDDDTCYEGEFTADMQLNGKGILTLPNGDYIEGQFHGNWGEGIKVNGIFNKFANPDPSILPVGEIASSQLSFTDFTVPAGIKWKSLFQACFQEMGLGAAVTSANVWKSIEAAIVKTRTSDVRRQTMRKRDFNKMVGDRVKVAKEGRIDDLRTIQLYVTEAIDTFGHPLNTLVEALIEVYRATYVGVGAHRRLLLHAVEEAKSYVSRLFNLIRLLFPALPDEDFVMLSDSRATGEEDHPVTSTTLLHPLILPRLYPPLFTLYALHTEKADALYTERLHQLNKRGNFALMSFLGVNKNFLLSNLDEAAEQPIKTEKTPYESAIDELESLTTKYSPMEKVEVIRRSFAKIHEEVDEFWKGQRKLMAMDDLFPVFQYVVVRARIPHLGSEIQFIEDLIERSVLVGEMGHMVTTLKACYFQIQKEQERD